MRGFLQRTPAGRLSYPRDTPRWAGVAAPLRLTKRPRLRQEALVRSAPQHLGPGLIRQGDDDIGRQPEQREILADLLASHAELFSHVPVAPGPALQRRLVLPRLQDRVRDLPSQESGPPNLPLAGPTIQPKYLK